MLTIKQVVKDPYNHRNERVRLWEGTNVEYGVNPDLANGNKKMGSPPNLDAQVSFNLPDGTLCSIDTGVVFVMNASGKTVDTYRLKGSEAY